VPEIESSDREDAGILAHACACQTVLMELVE
jgi:hypothetical protein